MAIELPNGKISLTLPEQVGHNARQISKIFQILDGLNVQDNVVIVDDISHVLTAQEITVLQQAVAFIVYDGHLYIKSGESGTNAYFDIVFSITPPGTAITFASSRITANLSNGALSIANSSVSTYSTTQIDTQLNLKADKTYVDSNFAALSGANFTGAITAPSIIENMSGYSFEKATDANAIRNYYYAGVVKTGNKITFVVFLDMILNTDIALSGPRIDCGSFNIPASIGSKLYPVSIGTSDALASMSIFANTNYINTGKTLYASVVKVSGTRINFGFYGSENIPTGTRLTARFEATFLLSDNLAS